MPTRLGLEDTGVPDCQHYLGGPPPSSLRRDHVFERHVAWEAVDAARRAVVVAASVKQRLARTPILSMTRALLHLEAGAALPSDVALVPRFCRDVVSHDIVLEERGIERENRSGMATFYDDARRLRRCRRRSALQR